VAEVFVARPGYAYVDSAGVLRAGGTVTLVNAEGTWIIIDTGGPSERSVVLDALDQNDLVPESIDYVVCTHGHIDHVGNNNLFSHATFLLGQDRSVGDAFETLDALSGGPLELAPGVQLMWTPGHTSEDISLLVTTNRGLVAVVGDLFENEDIGDESWVSYSRDPEQQRQYRAEILMLADFIVPGHGAMFSVADFLARG